MKENYFAGEMKLTFEGNGFFYMKIPDSFGANRFNPIKNFDAFAIRDGIFCALEYKMVKGMSLPIKSIRPIQLQKLIEIAYVGALSYFVINQRYKGCNCIYLIPIYTMEEQIASCAPRKSIPLSNFEEYKLGKVKVGRKTFWDITPIEERINGGFGQHNTTGECGKTQKETEGNSNNTGKG